MDIMRIMGNIDFRAGNELLNAIAREHGKEFAELVVAVAQVVALLDSDLPSVLCAITMAKLSQAIKGVAPTLDTDKLREYVHQFGLLKDKAIEDAKQKAERS